MRTGEREMGNCVKEIEGFTYTAQRCCGGGGGYVAGFAVGGYYFDGLARECGFLFFSVLRRVSWGKCGCVRLLVGR